MPSVEGPLRSFSWLRIAASGALWALVYNLLWGVAWFAFMRKEWLVAAGARRPLPFTPEVWFLWVVLTLPIGVALMAYSATQVRPAPKALSATLSLWLLMTLGMAGWGAQRPLSMRVIALDSVVNLVAMVVAAALAAAGSQFVWSRTRQAQSSKIVC